MQSGSTVEKADHRSAGDSGVKSVVKAVSKTHPRLTGAKPAIKLGTIPKPCLPLFVHESVIDEVLLFSDQHTDREVGGFLLGGVYEDGDAYIEVMDFLPAKSVSSSYRSLTFTHETWSRLHQQIQEQSRNLRVVGWHHTHPGFGVFLSRHDLFIHRSFFEQVWQVAMVVDPRKQELGFFQWQGDKLVNSGFLFVPASDKKRRWKSV